MKMSVFSSRCLTHQQHQKNEPRERVQRVRGKPGSREDLEAMPEHILTIEATNAASADDSDSSGVLVGHEHMVNSLALSFATDRVPA